MYHHVSPQEKQISRVSVSSLNPRVRQGRQELDPTGIRANWLYSVLGFNCPLGFKATPASASMARGTGEQGY